MNKLNNIGEYDRRFLIERPVIAVNPVGNAQTKTFETYVTLWGKFMPVASKEVFEAQQQVATDNVKIKTRYWPDVTAQMRITDKIYGGTYEISNVIAEKREDYLMITAVKRDNQ